MFLPKLAGFVVVLVLVLVLDKKPIHDHEDEDDKKVYDRVPLTSER